MKRKLRQNLQFVIRSELKKHSLFPYLWSSKEEHLKNLLECKSEVKSRDGRGFPRAGRAAPRDFSRALPSGNPSKQPCQPSENPVHPSSFTRINPLWASLLSIMTIHPITSELHTRFQASILSRLWPCWLSRLYSQLVAINS